MDFSGISDKDLIGGLSAVVGGVLRILLNVDPDIPKSKQFVMLFFAALPLGWSTYGIAVHYGFEVFAFPAGFFMGIMALSVASIIARDGAKALIDIMIRKTK